MHGKWRLALTTLVLLAALALIGAVEFPPHRSASRSTNSGNSPAKIATVVIHGFKFEPATVTVHAGETVDGRTTASCPTP
jgi:plastocyanin